MVSTIDFIMAFLCTGMVNFASQLEADQNNFRSGSELSLTYHNVS